MNQIIFAWVRSDSAEARAHLRLHHLEYLQSHQNMILAGGPALSAEGAPLVMVLCTRFTDHEAAEAFMAVEPYTASGQVFERIEIHPWSQVLPELTVGSLLREIDKEREGKA